MESNFLWLAVCGFSFHQRNPALSHAFTVWGVSESLIGRYLISEGIPYIQAFS